MLNYSIHVEGVQIDGHPINNFFTNFELACHYFDAFSKTYPYNLVTLVICERRTLKANSPIEKPLLDCPRGCTGSIDGKAVVSRGSNGKDYCRICDWREEAT